MNKVFTNDIKNFAESTRKQIEEIMSKGKEFKPVNDKGKTNSTKTYNKK